MVFSDRVCKFLITNPFDSQKPWMFLEVYVDKYVLVRGTSKVIQTTDGDLAESAAHVEYHCINYLQRLTKQNSDGFIKKRTWMSIGRRTGKFVMLRLQIIPIV